MLSLVYDSWFYKIPSKFFLSNFESVQNQLYFLRISGIHKQIVHDFHLNSNTNCFTCGSHYSSLNLGRRNGDLCGHLELVLRASSLSCGKLSIPWGGGGGAKLGTGMVLVTRLGG